MGLEVITNYDHAHTFCLQTLMFAALSYWVTTFSLVFGGCCANALTLEQLTLSYPRFGSLITFLQFLLIALHGLPGHLRWTWLGPRLKPRRISIVPYFGQVVLFYGISMLNNWAFAYNIPMPVHIIFRSGGLVVSMLFGWLISRKRYNFVQVLSVALVTVGVTLTTLSAQSGSSQKSSSSEIHAYINGIGLLTLALILSGFLGLLQEWTYKTYGKPSATSGTGSGPLWKESMFYLHACGLFMFIPLRKELGAQVDIINHATPRVEGSLPLTWASSSLTSFFPSISSRTPPIPPPHSLPSLDHLIPQVFRNNSFFSVTSVPTKSSDEAASQLSHIFAPREVVTLNVSLPKAYLPLLVNTLTQFLCVSGVHRLTTRVSNLTVTLILVVRKAASLVISLKGPVIAEEASRYLGVQRMLEQSTAGRWVWATAGGVVRAALGVDENAVGKKAPPRVDEEKMWIGAGLVLLGTVGYTIGTGFGKSKDKSKRD